ncbi:hypothetical protein B0F88_111117 [Methylobacter tundripaludum]|uniref:Uncharacterized protein n=1 Tax=Methylobacter tundripaludum TaxID=173365 RepID=A0A2S6GU43_9GAMM|nr:hypothetical protein B0F88_111117 [Methylobacter tundripaludum]
MKSMKDMKKNESENFVSFMFFAVNFKIFLLATYF